jgi:hypothetical protein
MTPGYLLDLLIINEVRKEKLKDSLEVDVKNDLDKQNGFLLKEIGKYLIEISEGKRPGTFSKHKNYDEGVSEEENPNLIKVLYKLYERHSELWDLEDKRRDTENNSSTERLSAADRVSIVNKKRNDLVEQVDRIINADLKKIKLWGNLVE